MILGSILAALEYPIPLLKGSAIQRSMVVKVVLHFFLAFLTVLFYQVSLN